MINNKIKKYLFKLRFKMMAEKLLNLSFLYLSILAFLCLLIISYSKIFDLPNFFQLIQMAGYISLGAFLVHFIIVFPRFQKVLKTADNLHFKERLMTAIEFADRDERAFQTQREDTIHMMKNCKVENLYKIKFNKHFFLASILLFALCVGVNYIETAQYKKNLIAAENIAEIAKESELLKKMLEKELKDINIDEKTIEEVLKNLDKNLEGIEDKKEALKALAMSKNELMEKLSKEDLKKIENALKEIDESQKKLAGDSLSDFAFNEEEKDNKGSDSSTTNDNSSNSSGSGENADTSNNESGDASNGENSSSENQGEGQSGSQNQGENSQGEGGENQEGNNQNASKQNGESGEGSQQGQNNQNANQGEGSESQNGQNAQGQGQNGQNGQNGTGGQSNQGMAGGNGRGFSEAPLDKDLIINPERIGNTQNNTFVESQKSNESDESTYKNAKTMPKEAGDFIDYKEVFKKYADDAAYTSEELEIPNGMRDLVKAYFESIQE